MSEGETRATTRHLAAALLITSAIAIAIGASAASAADAQVVDDTPGLGPNDFGAPSVIQPDTGTTAANFLPANRVIRTGPVSALQVRPNVYMLTVGGANLALLTSPQGSVVVDSGGDDCDSVASAVKKALAGPLRYVMATGSDPDRIGCASAVAALRPQPPAASLGAPGAGGAGKAPIFARAETLLHIAEGPQSANNATEVFTRPAMSYSVGGQGITALWTPAAITDGDMIVILRQADVIVTGNIVDLTRFPVINLGKGGSIQGEIDALNRLVEELTVPPTPKWQGWYGTLVIPGRGHLADQADLVNYRDMLTVIRDRIASLMKQGRNLVQVQAADPGRGYSARYGATTGPWTTTQFVEAVFKSLQAERRPARKE
jgi:glyoxylase-like metal-dependent hydrolase (beta-lactamase superfamily II)